MSPPEEEEIVSKVKPNRGGEAKFRNIKCDWLWPNALTPHLQAALANSKAGYEKFEPHKHDDAMFEESEDESDSDDESDGTPVVGSGGGRITTNCVGEAAAPRTTAAEQRVPGVDAACQTDETLEPIVEFNPCCEKVARRWGQWTMFCVKVKRRVKITVEEVLPLQFV